ncbi:restriction endonuclease [Candidatus Saccharibacteria bacterium]|nr:restriction endonuclease [Candidatus Saccharibacteria bacterium]
MKEMPKWNELFLLALKVYGDGKPHNNREAAVLVADSLGLPDELRREKNSKAGNNKIENRVGWAISALKIAGILEQHQRGENIITKVGKDLLRIRGNENFNQRFLHDNYPLYRKNTQRNQLNYKNRDEHRKTITSENSTPEELIENAMEKLDGELQNRLIHELRKMNPYQFEQVIADLLRAMGYGESFTTKKSGDGGVDAIVNEDTLGLGKIYAQAKRYADNNIVQEKAIRDFLGSLAANNIMKGVFITTSSFSDSAQKLAENKSIILIDGDKVTELMIEHNVGVAIAHNYQVKKMDLDYFVES